jgi:thiosulfate/3-mercaptopyruvate sulfurtransferase
MTTTTGAALLGTGELAADLGAWAATSPDRRILEVDEDTDAYGRGHIAGAVAVHWRRDLQDPVRRDFIGPEAFAALMDRLGVGDETEVVLYGGNSNWFAAYAYWYFKSYGHRAVRLLDGGRKSWELEGRPLTTEVPEVAPSRGYRPGGPEDEIRALRAQVLDAVRNGGDAALVDVRSPAEFSGEIMAPPHLPQEGAQRRGHIPGAVNIPWAKAVDPETGAFLPAEQLRTLYEGQGLTPDKEVIAYCRIGERSAHTWFVLHELLGYPRVRNYDGSWTEWGSLVGAPIERGDR